VKQHQQDSNTSKTATPARQQHQQDSNTSKTATLRRRESSATVRPAVGRVGRVGTASSERKVILGYYADAFPAGVGFRVLRVEKADVLVG
jgi:hypothetical protein